MKFTLGIVALLEQACDLHSSVKYQKLSSLFIRPRNKCWSEDSMNFFKEVTLKEVSYTFMRAEISLVMVTKSSVLVANIVIQIT